MGRTTLPRMTLATLIATMTDSLCNSDSIATTIATTEGGESTVTWKKIGQMVDDVFSVVGDR